ncbi:MAG TPA: hypothetical protein PK797_08145 [Burkholderiaceae bacterium]|nr:hypothetical protein [Burkholderiaceae bacterium]
MNTTDRSLYGIDLAVTLAAPYLVHGNDPGRFGLHATLLTDPQGRPVLPGSLLAGRIAEAWTAHGAELGGADADRWFGRPGFGAQDGAQRARLLSADLRLTTVEGQPFDPAAPCHDLDAARVRIDADTGSVAAGALLQVEQVAAPGAALRFAGRWTTWALPTEIDALCLQIRAALLLQTQLGAWRNVGFGRLLEVEVSAQRLPVATQRAAAPQPAVAAAAASSRRFALLSSEPLCVSTRSRRGNVFESGEVIPGAALLGALATQLCQRHGVATLADLAGRSTLARHFDTLRCSQALPAPFTGGRPLPLLQSLVSVKISPDHREIRDAWRHAELPPTPPGPPGVIAFQTDWKDGDFTLARVKQGWGETHSYLRVRTAIDGRGQARVTEEGGALFAYQCQVAPQDAAGRPLTRWLFDLDLGTLPDDGERRRAWAELEELLAHGLAPLGKTDARVQVRALADGDAGHRPVWAERDVNLLRPGDRLPLLLASDALLFPLSAVAVPGGAAAPQADLTAVYRAAFDALQQGAQPPQAPALTLSHFFATQRLVGGPWLHGRRGLPADGQPRYRPLVLTEAGSVFVFTVGPDVAAARAQLQAWRRQGLGLSAAVVAEHGGRWTDHPYLPSLGYGEVALAPQHGHPNL